MRLLTSVEENISFENIDAFIHEVVYRFQMFSQLKLRGYEKHN